MVAFLTLWGFGNSSQNSADLASESVSAASASAWLWLLLTCLVTALIALVCLSVWRNQRQTRLLNIMATARERSDMERRLIEASVFRSTHPERLAPSVSVGSGAPLDEHANSTAMVIPLDSADIAPLSTSSTVPWSAGAPPATGSRSTGTTPSLVSSDDFVVTWREGEGQVAGAANRFEPQFGGAWPLPAVANDVASTREAKSLLQMLQDSRRLRNEDPAAGARLALRHSKRMWKKIRVLILGLTAPDSAFHLIPFDVLRRIFWHMARSELPLVAVNSPAAPWARFVRGASA